MLQITALLTDRRTQRQTDTNTYREVLIVRISDQTIENNLYEKIIKLKLITFFIRINKLQK